MEHVPDVDMPSRDEFDTWLNDLERVVRDGNRPEAERACRALLEYFELQYRADVARKARPLACLPRSGFSRCGLN
jgi:hypothetical protein